MLKACCLSYLSLIVMTAPLCAEDVFPANTSLEMLWNSGTFTEGVAVSFEGHVYFSDISSGDVPGRVLKFDPQTSETVVHCADSGQSNGLMFDAQGRLIAACGANNGLRGLYEIQTQGAPVSIVSELNGKHFNSPNDLVIHPRGYIYFSDPRYVGPEPIEFDKMWVFMYQPETQTTARASAAVIKPNGLILSPDSKTLYVAETNNGSPQFGPEAAEPRMSLNAFPVAADGTLGTKRVLAEFDCAGGIDGMSVDQEGRIYAAFRNPNQAGIRVFSPSGEDVDFLATPELPTNCCFGRGSESSTLYITAGAGLYRARTTATGYHSVSPSNAR